MFVCFSIAEVEVSKDSIAVRMSCSKNGRDALISEQRRKFPMTPEPPSFECLKNLAIVRLFM